jgi:hypothetical protein
MGLQLLAEWKVSLHVAGSLGAALSRNLALA